MSIAIGSTGNSQVALLAQTNQNQLSQQVQKAKIDPLPPKQVESVKPGSINTYA